MVRVFRWDGAKWRQKGMHINGEAENDASGQGISMPDSNTIAIGAQYNDGTDTAAGHVRVFSFNCIANVTPNAGTLCTGESQTLTAAGEGTYAWSTGETTASIQVSPAVTTTYTVTVTNSSGNSCTGSSTITVRPVPDVNVGAGGSFILIPGGEYLLCPGDSMFFELQAPYDTLITWYKDGVPVAGANSQKLSVTGPGIYNVAAASNICPGIIRQLPADLLVEVCDVSSTNGIHNSLIYIYPTVAKDALYIENNSGKDHAYRILDLNGARVMQGSIRSGLNTVHIPELQGGIYILKTDRLVFRFVKSE